MEDINRYFEILGLKPGASLEKIREAYRDLVKVWHPDRFAHDPKLQQKAQEKLKEINEAYEKLMLHLLKQSELSSPVAVIYAGFWKRFAAILIDLFLILLVIFVSYFGIYLFAHKWWEAGYEITSDGKALIKIGWWLIIFVYYAGTESSSVQGTVGKIILRIKVTDLKGNKISFCRAIGRSLAKQISNFTLGLGYIVAVFTKKKQALHDMIVDTVVVLKD